jgi:hypothetical protein
MHGMQDDGEIAPIMDEYVPLGQEIQTALLTE